MNRYLPEIPEDDCSLADPCDCGCDCCGADYDADELGIDPELPRLVRNHFEELLRRKGRRYPGEIVED